MDQPASESVQTSWPGEREPRRDDVQQANEQPDPTFLINFKNALLASNDAKLVRRSGHDITTLCGTWNVSTRQTGAITAGQQLAPFTYPMSVLNEFPDHLPVDDIEAGRANFFQTFRHHAFVESLPLPSAPNAVMPPSLRYAFASLGMAQRTVVNGDSADDRRFRISRARDLARELFYAGARLDVLMIESDNRHARYMPTILAVSC